MRIALFGGTFDPIHSGHIELALAFARRLNLDKVLLMPTFVPPHKLKPHMAPAAHRLRMCELAAQPYPVLEVSDLEISRGGASFTADTLETLQGQYPEAQWYLITGADMFLTLATWWRFEDIAAIAVLCAAPRGDKTLAQLQAYAAVLEQDGARCAVEDIPVMDVSSTEIRRRVRTGEPLGTLVPPAVAAYIARYGLYTHAEEMESSTLEEQFLEILSKRLGKKRLAHSLAVAEEAQRLALRYGADAAKARTAGLLHDILKDTDGETQLQMLRDFGILLDTVEQHAPKLWHARAGAAFLEQVLGITDRDILQAVRYHTTARAGMSLLEKVLYLADFTSADRDYPDVDVMRRLVDVSIEEAMDYALTYSIRELLEKQQAIHPDTLAAYNELVLSKTTE